MYFERQLKPYGFLADFPQALAIVIINKLSTQGVPSFSGILGGFFFPHAII